MTLATPDVASRRSAVRHLLNHVRSRAALAVVAGTLLTACGTDAKNRAADREAEPGERGGTLRVLNQGDVDSIDPGITYYTVGYQVTSATQRPLVNFKPDAPDRAVPDLAESLPEISPDGRTVTVRVRAGVRFSPPVDREVTSADVKYAVERGFFKTVNNGYVGTYFGDVVGAKAGAEPGTRIPGIETPDPRTIVFRLKRPTGGALAGALSLPISAPVPREHAIRFDRRTPSAYGTHQVATGPYMVAADRKGSAVGYQAGRRIRLVRNPRWDRATDYKPAYVDEIVVDQGNDASVASRRILAGEGLVSGDFPVPPAEIAKAVRSRRDQIAFVPSGQIDYIPLNTATAPFDDLNVRRGVVAAMDREALRRVEGGRVRGPLATHFLPPSIPGFEQAGGVEGPGADFLAHPRGDARLAADYLRKAGFASGRYEGDEPVLLVSINDASNRASAQIVQQKLTELGFEVKLRSVAPDAFFTKFCGPARAEANACVGWGWIRDFPDGQTILAPTFHSAAIGTEGSSNASQLDDPAVDRAISRAETLTDPAERARAWAQADRLITERAPAIPGIWSNQPVLRSKDVRAVANANLAGWDFTFTSLD